MRPCGTETLDADDGAKAAVELREGAAGARNVGNGLSYIQITVGSRHILSQCSPRHPPHDVPVITTSSTT